MRDADGKRTRPDLSFVTHDGTVYIDVSVVCPFARTNAAMKDSVLSREQRKIRKYADSAVLRGAHFLPFALSSLGELGAGARNVIDLIAQEHHRHTDTYDRSLVTAITTSVSTQLQIGNAMVDTAGVAALGRLHTPSLPMHPGLVARRPPPPPPFYTHALVRAPALPEAFPSHAATPMPAAGGAADPAMSDSKRESKAVLGAPPSPTSPTRPSLSFVPSASSCSPPPDSSLHHSSQSLALSSQISQRAPAVVPIPLPTTHPPAVPPPAVPPDPAPIAS